MPHSPNGPLFRRRQHRNSAVCIGAASISRQLGFASEDDAWQSVRTKNKYLTAFGLDTASLHLVGEGFHDIGDFLHARMHFERAAVHVERALLIPDFLQDQ